MMKLAMVASVQDKCGVADYSRDLVSCLRKRIDVTVIRNPDLFSNEERSKCLQDLQQSGQLVHIQYHPDLFGSWRNPRLTLRFAGLLQRIRAPIVITVHDVYVPRADPGIGTGFRNTLKRIVFPLIPRTRVGRFLVGGFLKEAGHVIVHSELTKRTIAEYGVEPSRISVLYPGIPELPDSSHISARLRWGIDADKKIVTVFGFVRPKKGLECILHAMVHMPDAILLIAGGPADESGEVYLQGLLSLSETLAVRERVKVTGFLSPVEAAAALRGSDVVVLPYPVLTSASYALSYAAAAGRRLVVSDTPYFVERQRQHGAFALFRADDSTSLASAIRGVLEAGNETVRTQGVIEMDSWDRVAARTIAIYENVLREAGLDNSAAQCASAAR